MVMHCNVTNLSIAHKYIAVVMCMLPNIAIAVKIPVLTNIEHKSKFRFFSVIRLILFNVETDLGESPNDFFKILIGLTNSSKSRTESELSDTTQAITIHCRFAE